MKSSEIEFLWCNRQNWKLGVFYFCPTDPRVIVPKSVRGLGWTLNFARPLAFPALLGMLLFIGGPSYLLGLLNVDLHGYDWLLLAILAVALCVFCSRAASTRRFR
jgi:Family of unknown function (DUF5808)